MIDCRYGLPQLSRKSCSRLNQATQRSSQSAFASQCQGVGSRQSRVTRKVCCPEGLAQSRVNSESESRMSSSCKKATTQRHAENLLGAATDHELPTAPFRLLPPSHCPKCGAKTFMSEPLHFYCGNGDIEIASNEYPPELVYLFTSKDEIAVHFRTYARLYINLFAYSSLGGLFDAHSYKGISVFKLHGQMYHYVPSLFPTDDSPKYLQLYFYDGQREAKKRLGFFQK